jgi:hypothetical protein
MKLINTRSLVAALGLSLLAQGAWAQSASTVAPATAVPTTATNAAPAAIPTIAPTATTPNATTSSADSGLCLMISERACPSRNFWNISRKQN